MYIINEDSGFKQCAVYMTDNYFCFKLAKPWKAVSTGCNTLMQHRNPFPRVCDRFTQQTPKTMKASDTFSSSTSSKRSRQSWQQQKFERLLAWKILWAGRLSYFTFAQNRICDAYTVIQGQFHLVLLLLLLFTCFSLTTLASDQYRYLDVRILAIKEHWIQLTLVLLAHLASLSSFLIHGCQCNNKVQGKIPRSHNCF